MPIPGIHIPMLGGAGGGGAFPSIVTTALSTDSSGTVCTVTMPSGIVAGNLIVLFIVEEDDADLTDWDTSKNFTEIVRARNSGNTALYSGYRVSDGTEGASIDVTFDNNVNCASVALRISGAGSVPEGVGSISGNSANPDPPSVTPTWGAKPTLWLPAISWRSSPTITADPTDYTDPLERITDGTNGQVRMVRRELAAASENPGTFTLTDTEDWAALTVVIEPA